jgi:hypothetical protein
MAFILSTGNVISFAEYEDVLAIDQRLFEANEGLTDVIVEDALVKSTNRILSQLRSTDWWKSYYYRQNNGGGVVAFPAGGVIAPALDPNKIEARKQDFTDLCVYYALAETLLPRVADFGNADTAERQKIGFYDEKYRALLKELIEAGDWYDFDDDGTVESSEKQPSKVNLVRVR